MVEQNNGKSQVVGSGKCGGNSNGPGKNGSCCCCGEDLSDAKNKEERKKENIIV